MSVARVQDRAIRQFQKFKMHIEVGQRFGLRRSDAGTPDVEDRKFGRGAHKAHGQPLGERERQQHVQRIEKVVIVLQKRARAEAEALELGRRRCRRSPVRPGVDSMPYHQFAQEFGVEIKKKVSG